MGDARTYEPGTPSWVDLSSPDPAKAAEFYGSLFGWEAVSQGPAAETGGYMMFRLGGPDGPDVAGVGPGDRATTLGGVVSVQPFDLPHVGRIAVLNDPQGAAFSVLARAER
jgi:predicted enzyme related to lactoylglutathione lyase